MSRVLTYAAWLLVVPLVATSVMQWIASTVAGWPWVIALNAMMLLAVGFMTVRVLPGPVAIRLLLLATVPIAQYAFYSGETEPGFDRVNFLILGVEALLLWVGGFAAMLRLRTASPSR